MNISINENHFESLVKSIDTYHNSTPGTTWVHFKNSKFNAGSNRKEKLTAYELALLVNKAVCELDLYQVDPRHENVHSKFNNLENGLRKLQASNRPSDSKIGRIFSDLFRLITGRKTLGTIHKKIGDTLTEIANKKQKIANNKAKQFESFLNKMTPNYLKAFANYISDSQLIGYEKLNFNVNPNQVVNFLNEYIKLKNEDLLKNYPEHKFALLVMENFLDQNREVQLEYPDSSNFNSLLQNDKIASIYRQALLRIHLRNNPNLLPYLGDSPNCLEFIDINNPLMLGIKFVELDNLIEVIHLHKFNSIANPLRQSIQALLSSADKVSVKSAEDLDLDHRDPIILKLNKKNYQITYEALSKFSPFLQQILESKDQDDKGSLDLDELITDEKYKSKLAQLFEDTNSIFNPEIDPKKFKEFIEMANYFLLFQLDLEAMRKYHELLEKYAPVKDDLRPFMNK